MVSSQAQRLLDRFLCVIGSDWGSFISERHPEEKKKAPKCLILSVASDQASTFYKKHFFSQLCLLVGLGSGALLVGPRSAEPFPVCASAGMLDLLSPVC